MEEASLVDSLQRKLADLEHKVQAYRHDLAAEFLRYYHDVLRDVPPTVADNVHRTLAQSLSAYPTLSPDLNLPDSRMPSSPGSGAHCRSPLSATVSGAAGSRAAELPGSPHDREKEFHGLFTPNYLPLLDSSPQLPKSPPPAPAADPSSSNSSQFRASLGALLLPESGFAPSGQGTDEMVGRIEPEGLRRLSSSSQSSNRPGHVRQATDDTTSSVLSDRSDSKVPRSVLRRSSSSSKPPQSPRRVRFEFMGNEVLPTASPQPSEFIAPRSAVPDEPLESVATGSILEDDEDEEPPPRKISSSEALRALSREPLDEGTVWTVVNSNSDDILVEQDDVGPTRLTPGSAEHTHVALEPLEPIPVPEVVRRQQLLGSLNEQPDDDVDNDDSSDEEFLSMAKQKSFDNKKTIQTVSLSSRKMSTLDRATSAAPKSSPNTTAPSDVKKQDEEIVPASPDDAADDEDMFHFESGGLSAPPRPRPKPLPIEDEDVDDDSEPLPDNVKETQQSLYATSPAVPIIRQRISSGPTTPTAARFKAGSLGSYKGRPVIMPVVRNPEVHAQAASLGQFNTFVGGLDGRSGMDEGDLNSFRASFAHTGFSGTPRSLTERMMMEEAHLSRTGGAGQPQ